jgi:hypothetical protein
MDIEMSAKNMKGTKKIDQGTWFSQQFVNDVTDRLDLNENPSDSSRRSHW